MKKQNIKILSGLLALGILLVCAAHAQQTPEQTEIAEKAKNSTVRLTSQIDGKIFGGSGFFVKPDQIVTNIHVVAGADKVTVRLVGKKTEYKIEGVTAFDEQNDLVILQTTKKSGRPLTLSDSNSIEPGTSIFAVGTPTGGEEGQITHGTFHSTRKSDRRLRLKAKISPGNSGGPVLNRERAEVIGVAVESSEKLNISYAIPSNILTELLKGRSDDTVIPLHEWWQEEKNPEVFAYRSLHSANQILKSEVLIDDTPQVKDAIKNLDKVIKDNPHLAAVAHERKGVLLLDRLRDHQAAIENFKELTKLMPDYSVGYYLLGYAFLKSAAEAKIPHYESAINNFTKSIDFTKVIGLIPFVDVYFERGLAKSELGKSKTDREEGKRLYREAINDYTEVIKLNSDNAMAFHHRGLASRDLGQCKFTLGQSKDDQEEALSLYEAAVRDLDKAITDQREAIEMGYADTDQGETIKKEYANTYYSRGYMQLMLAGLYKFEENKEEAQRLYEAAVEDCKAAIRINPNLKTSVQQMQKMAEEALEQLKK